jgi:hypothetical protein
VNFDDLREMDQNVCPRRAIVYNIVTGLDAKCQTVRYLIAGRRMLSMLSLERAWTHSSPRR